MTVSYMYEPKQDLSFEHAVQSLENDIERFKKACLSDWPRPIDYANLLDAQYALKILRALNNPIPAHGALSYPK